MSWKEFKEQVEAAGVKDADEIFYIDTGNFPSSVETSKDEQLGIEVTGR